MAGARPRFEHPPVREVIVGLQFEPLESLRVVQVAEFLQSLAREWEPIPEVAPLGQIQDDPLIAPPWANALGAVRLAPGIRLRAAQRQRTRMLQVENGWFVYNWSDPSSGARYPGFDSIKRERDELLERWTGFLASLHLQPRPNLWEVTYVNVFPKGELWHTINDWSRLMPEMLGRATAAPAGQLETATARWSYRLPEDVGRLVVVAEHAWTITPEQTEILGLKLTARGPVRDGSDAAAEHGIDCGHRAIVETFAQITSPDAQRLWGVNR
jgi:uncharacterized protein (TIGR04255 family)